MAKKKHKTFVGRLLHHHIKLTVVPHKKNQYHPHIVSRYGIAIVLTVSFGIQGLYNYKTNGDVLGTKTNVTIAGLLEDTNTARAANNRLTLTLDDRLIEAANLKAQDMLENNYWAHESPSGVQPWKWINDTGYSYAIAGENLAKNFTNSTAIVSAWMNSTTHRENVLNPHYQNVGFAVKDGVIDRKNVSVVVAMYGAPATVAGVSVIDFSSSEVAINISPVARFGVAVQSMNPAAVGSVFILLFAAAVALSTHLYRNKMPKQLRKTWYRHHGLYKAIGLSSVAVFIILLYGGNAQI